MNLLNTLLPVLIEHAVMPALALLGAYLVTLLPGPVRTWLQSGDHQAKMDLLLGALARAALVHLPDLVSGRMTRAQAAELVVQYVRDNLPDTLRALAPADSTLAAMAEAALERAVQGEAATR